MIFKDEEQLKKFVLQKCKVAVADTERKIYDIIDKCLKQFYAQFEPEEYIRTEQLLRSLVKSDIKKTKNGYKAEVYFDKNELNYATGYMPTQSGRTGYATWDKDTILDVTMTGSYSGLPHGGYAKGTAIWTKSISTIDTLGGVYELLERELLSMGIPIKK